MKTGITLAIALTLLAGANVASVEAFGGSHKGGEGMHRGHMGLGENALVPQELRDEWHTEKRELFESMTPEERQEYFEEHRAERMAHRAEHKQALEDFVGLDREEIHELKKDGKTFGEILSDQGIDESDAEVFLTDQAEAKVERIVEEHDLSESEEQTLRDRIADFVQSMLDRWFGE